jgi:hypothetical protein
MIFGLWMILWPSDDFWPLDDFWPWAIFGLRMIFGFGRLIVLWLILLAFAGRLFCLWMIDYSLDDSLGCG